jgi:serine protease
MNSQRRGSLFQQRWNTKLNVEHLEDRAVPSAVNFDQLSLVNQKYADDSILVRTTTPNPWVQGESLGAGLYQVKVAPGATVASTLSFYQNLAGVEYAMPDYVVSVNRTPNDPSYGSLYGMNKIGAPAAWDVSTGSRSMVVAIIDTGIDYNHPDLAANMWRNTREVAGDRIDNDANGFVDDIYGYDFANNDGDPMDDNGHGTHVAGTIGAVGNNGVGVAGINWNVQMMALKFLSASGSGNLSNAVRALNYAVQMGAKISNNSYGGGGFFAAMDTAIANARAAGHIFVAAAGNEANNNDANPSYPAGYNYNNVVSVAATDSMDRLASFSNYGATSVDLAAPGVNIYSTTRNNTYSSFSGTSMAAPHVAGALALAWSVNPSLTYSQLISRMYTSVDPIAGLSGKVATGGRLNLARMMSTLAGDVAGASITGITFNGTTSITSATVTFSEAINASTFTATDVRFTGPTGAVIAVTSVAPVAGSTTSFTISFSAQTAPGTYTMAVGPNIADLAGNLMDQNNDGLKGQANDTFTGTRAFAAPPTLTTFTNSTQVAIRDNATVTSSLIVTPSLTISDVNVKINLRHTYMSDLVITLIAPDGTRILLMNRRGGSGDNITNGTFDDQASTAVTSAAAPFSGTFRPEAALSGLNGKKTNGAWRLEIRDAATQDVGTLVSWSIIVTSGSATSGVRSFDAEPVEFTSVTSTSSLSSSSAYESVNSSSNTSSYVNTTASDPVASTFTGGVSSSTMASDPVADTSLRTWTLANGSVGATSRSVNATTGREEIVSSNPVTQNGGGNNFLGDLITAVNVNQPTTNSGFSAVIVASAANNWLELNGVSVI